MSMSGPHHHIFSPVASLFFFSYSCIFILTLYLLQHFFAKYTVTIVLIFDVLCVGGGTLLNCFLFPSLFFKDKLVLRISLRVSLTVKLNYQFSLIYFYAFMSGMKYVFLVWILMYFFSVSCVHPVPRSCLSAWMPLE